METQFCKVILNIDINFTLCTQSAFHTVMKRPHQFEGCYLNVRPYISSLGILPLEHSTSTRPVLIPAAISIERIDPLIMEFWLKSEESRKSIEQDLVQVGCIVHWPKTSAEALRLECPLKQDDPNFHTLSKEWSVTVNERFIQLAQLFEAKKIPINQPSWDVMVSQLKSQKLPNLECRINRDNYQVLLIGRKDNVDEMVESINKQEAELEIRRTSVTENITAPHINEIKVKLMLLKYIPNLMKMYPGLQIDSSIKNVAISLTGPCRDITSARLDILKFSSAVTSTFLKVSRNLLQFVQREHIFAYINERLGKAEISVVLEAQMDSITMYASTVKECYAGKSKMRDLIKECIIPLKTEHLKFVTHSTWMQFKAKVDSNDEMEMIIEENKDGESVLSIIGITETVDPVIKEAEGYFDHSIVSTGTVQLLCLVI